MRRPGEALQTARRAGQLASVALNVRRMAKASNETARRAARVALAEQLGHLRGISMKLGQVLATGADDDPLDCLVNGAVQPLPAAQAREELERALGRPVESVFAEFEPAQRAASLGQVHRAVLLNGAVVAVKLQYPDVAAAVEAELRVAGWTPGLGPARRWGFDLDAYKRTLADNMARELDYESEARSQSYFKRNVVVSGLNVPRVLGELTTRTCLVQEWLPSSPLRDAQRWPQRERDRLGEILLGTLFASLFEVGCVHADPHSGNYGCIRQGDDVGVALYDFGCTVRVGRTARQALLAAILAVRGERSLDFGAAFAAMGFATEKLRAIAAELPALARLLFEPFARDEPFDFDGWQLSAGMGRLLGESKWWFRAAGPADLFLLLRAFQGVGRMLAALSVRLPWWRLALGGHVVTSRTLDAARSFLPPVIAADAARGSGTPAWREARYLKVLVRHAGEERVALTMPARAVLALGDVVPDEVRHRLEARGESLERIQARVSGSGLVPQVLFVDVTTEDYRDIRVWLE